MLSERMQQALVWASVHHAHQTRHNTHTPYISHLLATCSMVIEEGAGENLAIAALLHDALEDQPASRDELCGLFGADVLALVDACTDADFAARAGSTWHDRKRAHAARMRTMSEDCLLIIAADKVSSLQSLLDDLIRFGPEVLDASVCSAADLLWNYRQVHAVLQERLPQRAVVHRLGAAVAAFEKGVTPRRGGLRRGSARRRSAGSGAIYRLPRRG